jgi:hypothetical protein
MIGTKTKLKKSGIFRSFMCNICKDWELGKLSIQEARRNLGEAIASGAKTDEELVHFFEVAELIAKDKKDES